MGKPWKHWTPDQIKEKLLNTSEINLSTNCREWTGCKIPSGYGTYRFHSETHYVHRLAYEVFIGKIPKKMHILHSCHNRACIEPQHLRVGSHQENLKERDDAGRQARGERGGMSKLKDKDVIAIRRLFIDNISNCEIGRKFGVRDVTIRDIRIGKTWKHVM